MSQPSPAQAAAEEIAVDGLSLKISREEQVRRWAALIARHCQPQPCACCAGLAAALKGLLIEACCGDDEKPEWVEQFRAAQKQARLALAAYDCTKPA